jgi:hypothetical protein
MTMVIAFHEVDDRTHWLASPKRDEVFGPLGITHKTFIDPENPNRAGLVADVPDMDAFQAMLESEEGAAAMAHDGVKGETMVMLVEA